MMTNHSRTRTAHAALHKLAFGTALASGLALFPAIAKAQNTPSGQTVISPVGAGEPTFNGGTGFLNGNTTNLDVDLRSSNTIINWNSFNIANGSRVSFETGLAGEVAVLNRVTGGGPSNIRGTLNSDANVNVFLVNPNGILISGSGNVSTGSFVASTLAISNSDFSAGNYEFAAGFGGAGNVTVNGSVTTRGTGIGLILLGHKVTVDGALDSGTQDSALVAADDVTINYSAGSPLGIAITSGTPVESAMQIVGGTIQGRNVYFAMATRTSVTNSLLQIDGDVRAVGGEKGIVIVGGRSTIDPQVTVSGPTTSNSVDVAITGALTYSTPVTGGGVHIGATGSVTVGGAVTSAGVYRASGDTVTLGADGSAITQQANGAVTITATDGDITGRGQLILSGDADGSGGEALTLDADEDIGFGAATSLQSGGAGRASAINIFSGSRNRAVQLGDVSALTLDGGISGGALDGGLIRATDILGNGGDVTAGSVVLGGPAVIAARTLQLDDLSAAGAVALTATTMRVGAVTSTGAGVTIDAAALGGRTNGTGANVTGAAAVDIDVTNAALLGAIQSGAAVTIAAGSLDASSVAAGTGATLSSRSGDARLGSLTVNAGAASLVADDDAFITGTVNVSGDFSVDAGGAAAGAQDDASITGTVNVGGDYSVIGAAVSLVGTQAAAGALTVTARSGTVTNSGTLSLTSNSDGIGTEALTLGGEMALNATSTLNGGTARQSNVVIDTDANDDVRLGNVTAAALSIAAGANLGGDLVLGDVTTTADLTLRSSQSITTGDLGSTAGLVSLQAPVIAVGAIDAATDASLSGRDVLFTEITAGTATLATAGAGGTRRLTGTAVTTLGAATLTSDGGTITVGTIDTGAGLGVTSAGAVAFTTVDAAGDATIVTTGGSSDITIADSLTAGGAVSLTGGRNILAQSLASSGGALTISAAGNVAGGGGARANLSAATDLTLTAGGNALLGTVSANRIALEAGAIDAGLLNGLAGIGTNATASDLLLAGLTTNAGNATITAAGTVTLDGPVAIGGDYAVSGTGVTLGGVQSATGAVDIAVTGSGSIASNPGFQLTANSDGVGAETLTLRGRANLGSDSVLRGGPNRQSQVIIDGSANADFRLGDVDASSVVIAGGAPLSGSLTFGNIVTSDAVTLTVDGGIVGTGLTSLTGAITLSGSGDAAIDTLSGTAIDAGMGGNVAVSTFTASGGGARFASTGGSVTLGSGSASADVRVDALGAATLTGAIAAGGDYRVRAGSVALGVDDDAELQAAAGAVDITATSGALTGGTGLTLRSGSGSLILDGAGGIALGAGVLQAGTDGTGQLGLIAGNGQTINLGDTVRVGTLGSTDAAHGPISGTLNHAGALRFGTLDAASAVDIRLTGGDLAGVALNGAGPVAINVSGLVDIGAVQAVTLNVTGGEIRGGSYRATGDVALIGGVITLTDLVSTGGSAAATASAGTLSIDRANAAVDLTLTASGPGNVSVGTATAGRNLSLIARNGNVLNDSATAGGILTVEASGDILGRSGASPDFAGNDVVLKVAGNLTTSSITSPGALTVTASSITTNQASAGTALSLTASNGALSVGTATAGGAVTLNATGAIGVGSLTSGAGVAIDAGADLSVQQMTAPGAATIRAGTSATLGSVRVAGLTVQAASLAATDLTVTGASTLTAAGAVAIGALAGGDTTITAGTDLTINRLDARAAVLRAGSMRLNSLNAASLTLGGGSANVVDATVAGAVSTNLTGVLDIDRLSGTGLTLRAGSIVADDLVASGATTLTSTGGGVRVGRLNSGGAAAISATTDATVDAWQIPAALTITAPGAVVLGTGTAGSLQVTGGSIGVTNATLAGAADLTATGAISIASLTSGDATLTAGTGLTVDQLRTGAAILKAGSADLKNLTARSLTLSGGSASIGDATVTGAASVDLSGALDASRLSAADVTLLAGGVATLGTITGANAVVVRAGDVTLNGALRAPAVTIGSRDAAAGLRLGSASDGQGSGAALSETEIGRVEADRAVFDGGRGTVAIGNLAIGTGTGRTRVEVLTTGEVQVNGAVSGSGAGRNFRFGGSATTDTDLASAIRVVATAGGGGRLLFNDADVELRAARIGVGNAGLVDQLFAGGGISVDAAGALIGNSNSALYSALVGGEPYLPGSEITLNAARLTIRFNDFALFQNTGTRGFNTGVALSGNPAGGATLNLIGPGNGRPTAFAMFGTINGVADTSTAVLGNTVITTSGVDLVNARVNGCVLGTGAGCLTTTISQPTLNVFDPGRLVVFRAEADFTLPFDPVIGSNNEALFAGVGAVSDTPPECPPGDVGCTATQQDQE